MKTKAVSTPTRKPGGKRKNAQKTELATRGKQKVSATVITQGSLKNPKNAGRKPKLTPEELEQVKIDLAEYIENTDIPVINAFTYKHKIRRQTLYENKELAELVEWANMKKQAAYEIGMVTGTLQVAACIFALKQHGWKDRQEVETVVVDRKKVKRELERLFE